MGRFFGGDVGDETVLLATTWDDVSDAYPLPTNQNRNRHHGHGIVILSFLTRPGWLNVGHEKRRNMISPPPPFQTTWYGPGAPNAVATTAGVGLSRGEDSGEERKGALERERKSIMEDGQGQGAWQHLHHSTGNPHYHLSSHRIISHSCCITIRRSQSFFSRGGRTSKNHFTFFLLLRTLFFYSPLLHIFFLGGWWVLVTVPPGGLILPSLSPFSSFGERLFLT